MTRDDADWWRQAVVYQVYPRSFADANADGIGDLRGIRSRVPYLRRLGVDAVWLSPFYPSALADGGYDVDDYRDVDPRLGTLDDFDDLVAELHASGIRIIVDIVPNHTSNRHAWFVEALASPRGSAARNRYIFRDGLGEGRTLPPADWTSAFGGPAWEPVGDGQWYLHYFATEQPDLNWDNREVRDDFLTTLRFWSDRGVDGFRIDVAHGLAKRLDDELPDQAALDALPRDGGHPLWDRDEVHEIYAAWRAVFDSYSPPRTAVAEAWVDTPRRPRYASREGLGQAFNFDLLEAPFDAGAFRRIVDANLALASESGSSTTWVLSNHDVVRHATRYGLPEPVDPREKHGAAWLLSGGVHPVLDADGGLRRARAATLFMLGLPGSAYLYQGEELGLHEVADIPPIERQDPAYFRNPGVDVGRDGCRVPIPWRSDGTSFGFGSDGSHLPQPAWFAELSVEAQQDAPDSTLALYRRALELRRDLQGSERLAWSPTEHDDVVRFRRDGGWEVVINFGAASVPLPAGEVLVASGPLPDGLLPAETAAWLRVTSAP
ncbi:glycoside hydrolase family 13 protein [Agromyces humi]|uniref:glycoside hydrolase family 13 protein n=1 Tax=Agromyces humi TaxID=1766800 RepID=UPI0013595403|nr:glycoside hydrolase family 13 protein [Agromyces humi]